MYQHNHRIANENGAKYDTWYTRITMSANTEVGYNNITVFWPSPNYIHRSNAVSQRVIVMRVEWDGKLPTVVYVPAVLIEDEAGQSVVEEYLSDQHGF